MRAIPIPIGLEVDTDILKIGVKDNMRIRIAGTEFSIKNKSFEIYVQGCYRACSGCHNPETQSFEGGESVDIQEFLRKQQERTSLFPDLVKNIYITGGDLLCQSRSTAEEFSRIVSDLWQDKYKWLFTGCDFSRLPQWIWDYYDIVKCGQYMENYKQEGFPASSNQILIFNSSPSAFLEEGMMKKFNETEFNGEKRWSDVYRVKI